MPREERGGFERAYYIQRMQKVKKYFSFVKLCIVVFFYCQIIICEIFKVLSTLDLASIVLTSFVTFINDTAHDSMIVNSVKTKWKNKGQFNGEFLSPAAFLET